VTGILFALSLQSPTRWARGCVRMSWHKWDVTNEMCANDLSPSVFHEWNVCGWVDTRYMSQMKCVRMSGHEWDVTNEILVNELTHRICHKCVRMSGHEWDVANEICVNELSHRICHRWNVCEWVVTNEMSRMECVWMSCHTGYVTNEICANELSSTDGWPTYQFTECHTCESVMSHIWMSHVTHVNETYHEWDVTNEMSHSRMGYVTHVNESCHTCK